MIVEPAGRDEFLALMVETYGESMSPAEFDWWFDRNPAGPRILNEARDDDGTPLGALAMSSFRMSQGLAAFAVHAATTPRARGRGVFSTLELHNERVAAEAGASWALGFTNPMAGPILVGRVGWEDVTSLRIWVRPKRDRKSTRLNSSHSQISYAVFCLKKKIAFLASDRTSFFVDSVVMA